jgi:glutathione S-transferase
MPDENKSIDASVQKLIENGIDPLKAHRLGELARSWPQPAPGPSLFQRQMARLKEALRLGPGAAQDALIAANTAELDEGLAVFETRMEQMKAILKGDNGPQG